MSTLVVFAGLLIVALLVEPLARRLHLPFSATLVIVGFLGSELLVGFGFDTGLRWFHFTNLILNLFLPILVFESAFNLTAREVLKDLVCILYLAIPMFLLASILSGTLIYFGIQHPSGFPWIVALLTGTLLSATDPATVLEVFKKIGAPSRLRVLLQGESLFNDATAVVLFTTLLSLATMSDDLNGVSGSVLEFARISLGGILIGSLLGVVVALMMRVFNNTIPQAIVTLTAAIFSVYLAEHLFQVSGVMSALATGLIAGEAYRRRGGSTFTGKLWELNAYIAGALIFLLVGATITVQMFISQWLAMLIGIGAVLVTRLLVVFVLLSPVLWLPRIASMSATHRSVLFWGGSPGVVTLALALSLPLQLEAWFTVQSIAYGVVLFALFIQGPTIAFLMKRLKLASSS